MNLQQSAFPRDMNVKKGQQVIRKLKKPSAASDTAATSSHGPVSRVQIPGPSESAGDVTPTASR